jgi:hypothetical protein
MDAEVVARRLSVLHGHMLGLERQECCASGIAMQVRMCPCSLASHTLLSTAYGDTPLVPLCAAELRRFQRYCICKACSMCPATRAEVSTGGEVVLRHC